MEQKRVNKLEVPTIENQLLLKKRQQMQHSQQRKDLLPASNVSFSLALIHSMPLQSCLVVWPTFRMKAHYRKMSLHGNQDLVAAVDVGHDAPRASCSAEFHRCGSRRETCRRPRCSPAVAPPRANPHRLGDVGCDRAIWPGHRACRRPRWG